VGRPKLPKAKRKAEVTPIRFNHEDKILYQDKAKREGISLSDWIRKTLKSATNL
jgi:hypothetical protein